MGRISLLQSFSESLNVRLEIGRSVDRGEGYSRGLLSSEIVNELLVKPGLGRCRAFQLLLAENIKLFSNCWCVVRLGVTLDQSHQPSLIVCRIPGFVADLTL